MNVSKDERLVAAQRTGPVLGLFSYNQNVSCEYVVGYKNVQQSESVHLFSPCQMYHAKLVSLCSLVCDKIEQVLFPYVIIPNRASPAEPVVQPLTVYDVWVLPVLSCPDVALMLPHVVAFVVVSALDWYP